MSKAEHLRFQIWEFLFVTICFLSIFKVALCVFRKCLVVQAGKQDIKITGFSDWHPTEAIPIIRMFLIYQS